MLQELSATELADWRAYAEVEPFGEIFAHRATAIVAASLWNTLTTRKPGAPPIEPADLVPWLQAPDTGPGELITDDDAIVAAFDRLTSRR